MPRAKKKDLQPSLHGDIMINTRSNKIPRNVIGYAAEPVRDGGRVWRLHANGSTSWLVDTIMLSPPRASPLTAMSSWVTSPDNFLTLFP